MKMARKPKKPKPVNDGWPRGPKFLEQMIIKHGRKQGSA